MKERRKIEETKTTRIYWRFWFFFYWKRKFPLRFIKKRTPPIRQKSKWRGKHHLSSLTIHNSFHPPIGREARLRHQNLSYKQDAVELTKNKLMIKIHVPL